MKASELKEIIREIILEETTVVSDASEFIHNLFQKNKGKLPGSEVKKMFSSGGRYLQQRGIGSNAAKFVWNNLAKNNTIQKHGGEWVYRN